MNYQGIVIGGIAFLAIGAFHPIVIKAEYYFTYRCWPVFWGAGGACLVASALSSDVIVSCSLAIVGFSSLWSIFELFEQRKRVERGWFPENPARKRARDGDRTQV